MNKKFTEQRSRDQVELGTEFTPVFNEEGLIPCITVDDHTGEVIMFAWMNEEALEQTLQSGKATYYSRSREMIWVKGEISGRYQNVRRILVDCDQDVVQLKVDVDGEGSCHRGFRSCFYRTISDSDPSRLRFIEDKPAFDPDEVYGNRKSS